MSLLKRPHVVFQGEEYLPCEDVLEFLWAYVGGELPADEMRDFERHLSVCDACVSYLETYRQTIDLTRGTFEAEDAAKATEDLPEDLIRAVLAAKRAL